jgi:hypothetical protein
VLCACCLLPAAAAAGCLRRPAAAAVCLALSVTVAVCSFPARWPALPRIRPGREASRTTGMAVFNLLAAAGTVPGMLLPVMA